MGLGPLANALVQMELGESMLGALSMNTQGPDDASMMTILAHGTEYQKEKFLKPLLNGDKRICFSMTEKAAGADATGMQTPAVKDGNENYILNGEKWFSSSASVADMALVMAKTDPERAAPQAVFDLHRRTAEPRLQDQAQCRRTWRSKARMPT